MLDAAAVTRAARAAGLSAPALFEEATGSTNTDLLEMAARGAPEWTLIVAGHLTAGRGRLGRTWSTQPGLSLATSVLLRPRLAAADAPLLSLLAGVAMAEACREGGPDVRCKWPNDLVIGERKLGGILTEASVEGGRLRHVVIGTGVNVRHAEADFLPDLRETATSLAMEGTAAEMGTLLERYLVRLRALYGDAGSGATGMVPRYRSLCSTIGRMVRATTTGSDVVEGRAVAVADRGDLLVETLAGVRAVTFGEVEHLR